MIEKNMSLKLLYKILITQFLAFILVLPVFPDIYRYVDENGILHFTDSPKKSEFILYFKSSDSKNDESKKKKFSPDIYNNIILKASQENGLSFSLVKALIKVESNFNPNAVSRVGAKGLMQLMPVNIKRFKIKDPFNPYENIMGGTLYFRQLLDRFNGKLILALAAYNAGPTVVSEYNSVPPYRETKRFVKSVLKYNYKYKSL